MKISRRDFCRIAGGSSLLPLGTAAAAWPVLTSLPFGQNPARTSPLVPLSTTTTDPSFASYSSTLVNGYTPQYPLWSGKTWKAAMGSVWNRNLDHCWRTTPNKLRFELHDATTDRAKSDESNKRRSEIHANRYPLPNGVSLWGAYSFNDHAWADPVGMSKLQGGAHAQMHMPQGGSPAFAFRRDRNGSFLVTTNGANDSSTTMSVIAAHCRSIRCMMSFIALSFTQRLANSTSGSTESKF